MGAGVDQCAELLFLPGAFVFLSRDFDFPHMHLRTQGSGSSGFFSPSLTFSAQSLGSRKEGKGTRGEGGPIQHLVSKVNYLINHIPLLGIKGSAPHRVAAWGSTPSPGDSPVNPSLRGRA